MTNTTSTESQVPATQSSTIARKSRRMAPEPKQEIANAKGKAHTPKPEEAPEPAIAPKLEKSLSKLDQVEALLLAPTGASLAELVAATCWQQHSVRGAMAGALKKRGLVISSDKVDGIRRYRASKPA